MNSNITFPGVEPTLKLARPPAEKWAATLSEERRRLQEDQDILREREQNLREYESRLRSLQAEIEAGRAAPAPAAPAASRQTNPVFPRASSIPSSSTPPFADDPVFQGAWEKLHRAREILEAEQKNLRDERISMRELELQVKRREEAAAVRETRLAEREALIAAASPAQPNAGEHTFSAVTRLTRAPFNMACSVFRGRK